MPFMLMLMKQPSHQKTINDYRFGFQQITAKSFYTLYYRSDIKASIHSLETIYLQSAANEGNIMILTKFVRLLKRSISFIFTNFILCQTAFITAPGLIYLLTGSVLLILPSPIPGVDHTTTFGYILNMLYHACMVSLAAGLYIYSDGLLTVQVLHVILMSNILRKRIQDVSVMSSPESPHRSAVHIHFRNILILHNDMMT